MSTDSRQGRRTVRHLALATTLGVLTICHLPAATAAHVSPLVENSADSSSVETSFAREDWHWSPGAAFAAVESVASTQWFAYRGELLVVALAANTPAYADTGLDGYRFLSQIQRISGRHGSVSAVVPTGAAAAAIPLPAPLLLLGAALLALFGVRR